MMAAVTVGLIICKNFKNGIITVKSVEKDDKGPQYLRESLSGSWLFSNWFPKKSTSVQRSLGSTQAHILTQQISARSVLQVNLFLLLLCRAGKPLVQQLLAVVDLPAVHLHSNDDHQVHDGYG